MRRPAVVLSAVLLLGGCAGDDTPTIDTSGSPAAGRTTASQPSAAASGLALAADAADAVAPRDVLGDGDVAVAASLTGDAVYPGLGDDGQGSFTGTLAMVDDGGDAVELCYDLEVAGLSMPPAAAHVHRGIAGAAGEVVAPLVTPRDGSATGCVDLRSEDAALVLADPSMFYVNVHTDDYPDGAVRGQLAPAG